MRRSAGFSLLEVLLVVALIALAGTLAVTVARGGLEGMRLRSSARTLAAELRFTRAQAIASGQVQRFEIDPASHRWRAAGKHHGDVPKELAIAFIGAREVQPSAGVGAIQFWPDGASSGGRVRLSKGRASWDVDVAWLTGRVVARATPADEVPQ